MDMDWVDATQPSSDSQEGQTYLELIKKIQADKTKKKREKEAQLLVNAKKNLNVAVTKCAVNLANVVVDMENNFDAMLTEYAEIEDTIRKLWLELIDEHEHFISLCDAKEAAFKLVDEQREEQHDSASRSVKAACKEISRAALHIDPDSIPSAGQQAGT